jgi:type II secretory pathway pseudopilin PulG
MRQNCGYSLAELIVAAAIVTLTVVALAVVLRKGSEITVTDVHEKRARSVIDSCFESPAYDYRNYGVLPAVNRSVVVDPRDPSDAGDDLVGNLTITVEVDTSSSAGTDVEYKKVTVQVDWQEPEGPRSITMEKRLTDLGPW